MNLLIREYWLVVCALLHLAAVYEATCWDEHMSYKRYAKARTSRALENLLNMGCLLVAATRCFV
jgi:hypothetical protein